MNFVYLIPAILLYSFGMLYIGIKWIREFHAYPNFLREGGREVPFVDTSSSEPRRPAREKREAAVMAEIKSIADLKREINRRGKSSPSQIYVWEILDLLNSFEAGLRERLAKLESVQYVGLPPMNEAARLDVVNELRAILGGGGSGDG